MNGSAPQPNLGDDVEIVLRISAAGYAMSRGAIA